MPCFYDYVGIRLKVLNVKKVVSRKFRHLFGIHSPYELKHISDIESGRAQRNSYERIISSSDAEFWIDIFAKDLTKMKSPPIELERGSGITVSVFICDYELLKFDCIGEVGHFHAAFQMPEPHTEIRLKMYEKEPFEQLRRSLFEIKNNLNYYQARNPIARVRKKQVNQRVIEEVCTKTEIQALEILEAVFDTQE